MKLRPYQSAAIHSIYQYFKQKSKGNPLVVAPTGSGKSHILAGFCKSIYDKYPQEKILIITHTKEIIRQNKRVMLQYIEDNSLIGVYSAGLSSKQIRQFTHASIQSIYKKAELFKDFNLIIVDEAHLIPPDGEGRYQTFLGKMDHVKVVGLTATPFRRGHGMLTEGHIFDKIVYDIKISDLIDLKHLAPLSTKATEYALNVKGIKVVAGDYSKTDLSRQLDHSNITDKICTELLKFKDVCKSWLIFAIDIEHCKHISDALNKIGIVSAAVHSKLDIDRQHLLDLFTARHIQALVSVETLTTGFDAPNVDMIVLMRPTQSPVLHVQMLGRGMRPYPDKDMCLVLDFAGNVQRLGPVDYVEVKRKRKAGKGDGTGFTRVCPKCKEIVHISKKICPSCGFVFPIAPKLSTVASTADVLGKSKIFTLNVKNITYAKHKKSGKPASLKVTYYCGTLQFYHSWIAFEHKGFPRKKAVEWWLQHSDAKVPDTVDEALTNISTLKRPKQVKIEHLGKYPNVIGLYF